MKRITAFALIVFFSLGVAFAKDASKHVTLKNDVMTLTYGQPTKSTGAVVPADGTSWGTGVGELTTVTLSKGCLFAGRQVNPGTYNLITVPFKGEWLVFLVNPGDFDMSAPATLEKLRENNLVSSYSLVNATSKDAGNFDLQVNADGIVISWDKKQIEIPVKPW